MCLCDGSMADAGGGDSGRSGDDHALISSRLFSSPPLPSGPPAAPPSESLLRSFATPPYASCTTENAADAFEEKRPHMERTPTEDSRSDEVARGEGGGRGLSRLERGEGERGVDVWLAPGEEEEA